jgi:hypothetical protein
VHYHTTQYFWTLKPNAIYIDVVHWYTVRQLCFPVPIVSNPNQFNSWWYTGTLSHNSVLLKTLTQAKCNLFVVEHWYTVTQLCSPMPAVSNQSQFNSWWYTGTLSHNFVPQCLLYPNKVNLIHGGTLVHCHITQYFCCDKATSSYISR